LRLRKQYQENVEQKIEENDFELRVRTWYLTIKCLTPFDDRYLSVPYEWMEFEFLRYMNNPGYDVIRDLYLKSKYKSDQEKEYEEELEDQRDLIEGTYTKEQIMKAFRDAR
jgi:hypothetical protein